MYYKKETTKKNHKTKLTTIGHLFLSEHKYWHCKLPYRPIINGTCSYLLTSSLLIDISLESFPWKEKTCTLQDLMKNRTVLNSFPENRGNLEPHQRGFPVQKNQEHQIHNKKFRRLLEDFRNNVVGYCTRRKIKGLDLNPTPMALKEFDKLMLIHTQMEILLWYLQNYNGLRAVTVTRLLKGFQVYPTPKLAKLYWEWSVAQKKLNYSFSNFKMGMKWAFGNLMREQ